MTFSSFRKLQAAVREVDYLDDDVIPYTHFSRYGATSDAAKSLEVSISDSRITVDDVVDAAIKNDRFQNSVLSELGPGDSQKWSTLMSTRESIVEFLRVYNRACVDAFVYGRMYELASSTSTSAQGTARKRAVGLVRRGIEQNGLAVSPPAQPPLDDETTVKVLAWGRVLGVALTFEDIYALCVTSVSWENLVDTSSPQSGLRHLFERIFSTTSEPTTQPLSPLPALPEPEDRPALPSN